MKSEMELMKQEEMKDICTILVEPKDERTAVWKCVSSQKKPVVIVLQEDAEQIFQRPGDFNELKRIKRERKLPVTLVISGNERIRTWARRQGFTVYSSTETCARALSRRDRLNRRRSVSRIEPEIAVTLARRISGSLSCDTEEIYPQQIAVTGPLEEFQETEPLIFRRKKRRDLLDRILLVLLLILLLAIVSGIVSGYLLSVLH